MKPIGKTFSAELKEKGLTGLPFAWGNDGSFTFDPNMTEDQIKSVMQVYEAHDPTKEPVEVPIDPLTKLSQFLASNPDVANLLK